MNRFKITITDFYEVPDDMLLSTYGTDDRAACAAIDAKNDPFSLLSLTSGEEASMTVEPVEVTR